ncbi:conserved hypothetical protein [Verticillium alfalfae VaMs.102]|uniref:Uncharacterized protein n=1 Tax=Verticillium alfalfae (strain VaMs.102 / ATCC MYA-4576 / FGSC 10136) TaxID=526221 RepID=C9SH76_VERA1|nr:conserved hypothetical protein [Verticillium alfalfae VaMs.102]EEY17670.1 conserved hypothetical protein [Verticillium alfalfae VaMs.102]
MAIFSYLRSIYDLDTLDTRFTSPSSVPYKTVVEARADPALGREPPIKAHSRSQPSKWRSPEFLLYYLVLSVVVPWMFWIAYDVSRPTDPRYHKYERLLSDGWIPGRKIDVSDQQYSFFRSNLPAMSALLVVHPLLRKAWNSVFPVSNELHRRSTAGQGAARLTQRASFDYIFALVFLAVLHGVSALKVLAILG